jgi:hypothetical protein
LRRESTLRRCPQAIRSGRLTIVSRGCGAWHGFGGAAEYIRGRSAPLTPRSLGSACARTAPGKICVEDVMGASVLEPLVGRRAGAVLRMRRACEEVGRVGRCGPLTGRLSKTIRNRPLEDGQGTAPHRCAQLLRRTRLPCQSDSSLRVWTKRVRASPSGHPEREPRGSAGRLWRWPPPGEIGEGRRPAGVRRNKGAVGESRAWQALKVTQACLAESCARVSPGSLRNPRHPGTFCSLAAPSGVRQSAA